jgi:hypothetical protein
MIYDAFSKYDLISQAVNGFTLQCDEASMTDCPRIEIDSGRVVMAPPKLDFIC